MSWFFLSLFPFMVSFISAEEFLPGINSKALINGEAEPAMTKKFRIHGMKFCPFTERVELYVSRKNLEVDVVNINLADKPDWYVKKHKKGSVPTFQLGDTIIGRDSMKIAELLDVIDPETTVLPEDEKLREEELEKTADLSKKIMPFIAGLKKFGMDKNKSEAKWKDAAEKIARARQVLQPFLKESPYLGGEAPGFSDYMIFPLAERLWVLENMWQKNLSVETPTSEFSGWFGKMVLLPEVIRVLQPLEGHIQHFETVFSGQPDYDLEVNSIQKQ